MTLIPAFEIGVWNAWIFMSYLLLSVIPFMYIAVKKHAPSVEESGLSRVAKMFASSSKLLLFPAMINRHGIEFEFFLTNQHFPNLTMQISKYQKILMNSLRKRFFLKMQISLKNYQIMPVH